MNNLNLLTATQAAQQIAAGTITSEALVRDCVERIQTREGEVRAWVHFDPEAALAQARARDKAGHAGPLSGIPVAFKDVIDTCDMPARYGSPIYKDHRPRTDAACAAIVLQAGGIVMGKTVTTEFATRTAGPTRNPHNLDHTPGGSSSGSGASVADFMVPLAFGTQTGGSNIRPAAYCGIVGYKPSWKDASPATHTALENAAAALAKAGADVRDFALPDDFDGLYEEQELVMNFDAARALAYERFNQGELLSAHLRNKLAEHWETPRSRYEDAHRHARACRLVYADLFSDIDVLLTPSAPDEAPKGIESTGTSLFNRNWTLLGAPCVTLPYAKGAQGLPIGIQLVGAYDDDARVLQAAEWVRQAIS